MTMYDDAIILVGCTVQALSFCVYYPLGFLCMVVASHSGSRLICCCSMHADAFWGILNVLMLALGYSPAAG